MGSDFTWVEGHEARAEWSGAAQFDLGLGFVNTNGSTPADRTCARRVAGRLELWAPDDSYLPLITFGDNNGTQTDQWQRQIALARTDDSVGTANMTVSVRIAGVMDATLWRFAEWGPVARAEPRDLENLSEEQSVGYMASFLQFGSMVGAESWVPELDIGADLGFGLGFFSVFGNVYSDDAATPGAFRSGTTLGRLDLDDVLTVDATGDGFDAIVRVFHNGNLIIIWEGEDIPAFFTDLGAGTVDDLPMGTRGSLLLEAEPRIDAPAHFFNTVGWDHGTYDGAVAADDFTMCPTTMPFDPVVFTESFPNDGYLDANVGSDLPWYDDQGYGLVIDGQLGADDGGGAVDSQLRPAYLTTTSDQYVESTVSTLVPTGDAWWHRLHLRARRMFSFPGPGETFYVFAVAGGPPPFQYEIYKYVAGTYTSLATLNAAAVVAGQRLRFEVQGDQLRGYVDGVLKVSATDSDIPVGHSVGITYGWNDTGTDLRIDDLEYGDL